MKQKKILISILNWNKAQQTLACVSSLQHDLKNTRANVSILVIDNGSRPEDVCELEIGLQSQYAIFKKFPVNLGFTGGHNESIKMAIDEEYDFIWLLNNDALVFPGALSSLLTTMLSQPECGAASPVIRDADDQSLIASCLRTHDWTLRTYNQAISIPEATRIQSEQPKAVWLVGTAIFFRVEALKQIGLLDERLFAYYDDDDIGVRLSSNGWTSQCVFTASVSHGTKRPTDQYPLYFYYLMQRNEMLFWHKHTPPQHRRLLWLKLLDKAFFNVNRFYRNGLHAQGDAALLGTYDFIIRRFGTPDTNRRVPLLLRVICKISDRNQESKAIPVKA